MERQSDLDETKDEVTMARRPFLRAKREAGTHSFDGSREVPRLGGSVNSCLWYEGRGTNVPEGATRTRYVALCLAGSVLSALMASGWQKGHDWHLMTLH